MSIGISGRVTDFDSGAGVPGASVILVDSSGNATGPGTAADSSGYYSLSDDSVTDPNTWVQFSSVGYFTTRQLASELLSSGNYQMISSSTSLPTATVTATKPTTATPAPTTPTTNTPLAHGGDSCIVFQRPECWSAIIIALSVRCTFVKL